MTDLSIDNNRLNRAGTRTLYEQTRFRWFAPLCVFCFGAILAYLLLTSIPGFVGTDDYYHSRMAAQIITQRSLRLDFPWLPLTILSPARFVDHHLLYHVYLAPWMAWGGVTGVKIAQSIVSGALAVAFWSLLRFLHVRLTFVWTLALIAVSAPFLYRMLMIRTQAAAVLLLLVTLHSLFRRRYSWLVILAFAFTWLYNGFVLLPAVTALYTASAWTAERRFEWKPILYTVAGTTLGLVINPYFPQNMIFIIEHLGEKVDIAGSVRVGSEWYPYTTVDLLENSLGALLAFGIGILAGSFRRVGRDHIETTLLLVALLTLVMLFRSRRFIEYFPVFSLLFCAVAWGRSDVKLRSLFPGFFFHRPLVYVHRVFLLIPLLLLASTTLSSVHKDIQGAKDIGYMAGASAWLQANSKPGTLLFQTDWDDFTRLFYHNTQNAYLVGLDPTYLQLADPVMWNQWVAITQGRVERPSVLIRETFGATYVVSDTQHDAFAQRADDDPDMYLVYRDGDSLIWQIGDSE